MREKRFKACLNCFDKNNSFKRVKSLGQVFSPKSYEFIIFSSLQKFNIEICYHNQKQYKGNHKYLKTYILHRYLNNSTKNTS